MTEKLPTSAALVLHEVESYDLWRPKFDAHEPARRAAGILGHHVQRNADNPNLIAVYMPHPNIEGLQAFLANDDLRAVMKSAGVKGTPDIKLMDIRSNDDVEFVSRAGLIVLHKVADYDKWRAAYDEFDETRKSMGITGHAVNTLHGDPTTVVVYHQAKSLETLKEFLSSDALKDRMHAAGVVGPPTVSLWNTEVGKMY